MEHLFAGWRMSQPAGVGADGQPHVDPVQAPGQSLFEAIEQSGRPDAETYILARRSRTFAILNVFPYTNGHVMVLPLRAAASLDDLDEETYRELWSLVRDASRAVKAAFHPQGLNIGINEGQAGGGSHPDHLHVHVVPRWSADTNFMTTVADARVLPMSLGQSWAELRAAWPE
jgi:diadenosine tetraphosphate (Ap4A) HIT family hydrolase